MNPRAEGPSLPGISSTKGSGREWEGWEWEGVFDSAVVVPLCCLHSLSGCIRDFIGAVPFDVVVASRIHF